MTNRNIWMIIYNSQTPRVARSYKNLAISAFKCLQLVSCSLVALRPALSVLSECTYGISCFLYGPSRKRQRYHAGNFIKPGSEDILSNFYMVGVVSPYRPCVTLCIHDTYWIGKHSSTPVEYSEKLVTCLAQVGFAAFDKVVQLISGSPYAKAEHLPD